MFEGICHKLMCVITYNVLQTEDVEFYEASAVPSVRSTIPDGGSIRMWVNDSNLVIVVLCLVA